MSRVLVVGAGVGGLAVAARLAATGHQVTVCEQAPGPGGKLAGLRHGRHVFDTGPSLLTLPTVYRDLFAATGGELDGVLDITTIRPGHRYYFADGMRLDIPTGGTDAAAAAIGAGLGAAAAAEWAALMRRAAAIWAATRRDFVESALDGPRVLARMAVTRPRDLATVAPLRTLRGIGRRYLNDLRLRTMLDRYATYSGSDPRRAPAAMAVVPYVEQTFGSWHIRGGLHRLGIALADRAAACGADLRYRTDVVAITVDGRGRVDGARLRSGERLAAGVVVADVDAGEVYGRLLPGQANGVRRIRRRLARAVPSYSGFVLLLAVRGRVPDLAHHTVLFPADYDREFDALAAGRVVADPTVYVCAPDDPTMRPDEGESCFVLVNAPRQGPVDWTADGLAERYALRLLDVLAARGVDLRDRVSWRTVRTPADLERDTRAPGGSIYGSASNGPRSAFLRPANRSPVPGLYLVGGSAHPGGGLPLVAQSAAITAGLIGPA